MKLSEIIVKSLLNDSQNHKLSEKTKRMLFLMVIGGERNV